MIFEFVKAINEVRVNAFANMDTPGMLKAAYSFRVKRDFAKS